MGSKVRDWVWGIIAQYLRVRDSGCLGLSVLMHIARKLCNYSGGCTTQWSKETYGRCILHRESESIRDYAVRRKICMPMTFDHELTNDVHCRYSITCHTNCLHFICERRIHKSVISVFSLAVIIIAELVVNIAFVVIIIIIIIAEFVVNIAFIIFI